MTGVGAGRAGRALRGEGVLGGPVAWVGARRLARSLTRHHARTGVLAHAAIAARVRAGDQVGAVPYGYRRGEGPRRRLIVDEPTAAVVVRIFTWRATSRIGATRIAGRLDADPDRYPPPLDTRGVRRRWTRGLVRHILANPAYTGRHVWGRTHHGRPVPAAGWVASAPNAHPRLVDDLTFNAAQRLLSRGRGFVVTGINGRNHSDAGLASTISGTSSAVAARASRRHEAGEST